MNHPTIDNQGSIVSAEMLDTLERDAPHQDPKSFGLGDRRVKDEIASAWSEARHQWKVFQSKMQRLPVDASGTSETRQFWIVPLLDALGYRLTLQQQAEVVNGQTYAISHRDQETGGFPVHITGFNRSLDRRRESGGPRLSPHALVQEYLNVTEHLYALVTNGYQLRLLRNSSRLTRLSYVEFDLVRMMEDEVIPDFAVMYRLLHRTRMPQSAGQGGESIIEQYHQNALETGAAIRSRLSGAVRDGIARMAEGLLQDPSNVELRRRFASGELNALGLYNELLRLVYRLLFLLVIEERNLIFPKPDEDEAPEVDQKRDQRHRTIYRDYYGIGRLRRLAERPQLADARRHDLWISLFATFRLFESADVGKMLGISSLAGELFGAGALDNLRNTRLENGTLLSLLGKLFRFRTEHGEYVNVNYAALNVEEFGSVYEGLLELKPVVHEGMSTDSGRGWAFTFSKSDERSTSGSHYTPDELVRPLIEHGLDPVIEQKLANVSGDSRQVEQALLSLKVCDVACGSGHFLLAASRRIAYRLAQARSGEEQPSPLALRTANRDVISHCIYGVDKNPMAVELCKVALWLEAHDPGKPLTFLDHRIKCGDAVVGLARPEDLLNGIPDEAFKALPGDDKVVARSLRQRNKEERKQRQAKSLQLEIDDVVEAQLEHLAASFRRFDRLPDTSMEERSRKEAAYAELSGPEWFRLKALADAAVAPFYLRKTAETGDRILTDGTFRRLLHERSPFTGRQDIAASLGVGTEKRFFHWFLEFPEVLVAGGFDCILGNPPYLGAKDIAGSIGKDVLEFVKYTYLYRFNVKTIRAQVDLASYFLRRMFDLLRLDGRMAVIVTDSVSQGDGRIGGLSHILDQGGNINSASTSVVWPGKAAVEVSLISLVRGALEGRPLLNGDEVDHINSFLAEGEPGLEPYRLASNKTLGFTGAMPSGEGFVVSPKWAHEVIRSDSSYRDVLFPYYKGSDIMENHDMSADSWIINFHDWNYEKARQYPICLEKVESDVKPQRLILSDDNATNRKRKRTWWLYGNDASRLYGVIEGMDNVLVTSETTKYLGFARLPTSVVFGKKCVVLTTNPDRSFAVFQSSVHDIWARMYGSARGGSSVVYATSYCVDNFPMPDHSTGNGMDELGERYNAQRASLMLDLKLGLTKLYNLFHTPGLTAEDVAEAYAKRDRPAVESLEEYPARIEALRQLHRQMDEAVARAYGWSDLDLGHAFHEIDVLPENDRVRYTISPEARKEVLRRLLLLNHKRYEEEQAGNADGAKEAKPAQKKGAVQPREGVKIKTIDAGTLFGTIEEREQTIAADGEREPATAQSPTDRSPARRAGSSIERKAGDRKATPQFERAVLAAELVERLRGTKGFGRIKLQKAIYLCEQHAGADIKSDYLKEKHGPFDPAMMGNVEQILKQNKWAERVKRPSGKGFDYVPLARSGGHRMYYDRYWTEADNAIQNVIDHLSGLTGRESEIVATLYAVWQDLLSQGEEVTTRALVGGALAWHEQKEKIHARDWEWWVAWMRERGLCPEAEN